jgi:hypothetical protein
MKFKYIEKEIERCEYDNEHGVKITNKLVRRDKVAPSGNIMATEFIWYQDIDGTFSTIRASYKTEKRMRKAMADNRFYVSAED